MPETTGKQKAGIAATAVAVIGALTGAYTAFHGSHSETTAVTRNDTPLVINRPHDASGSPLPVTVVTQKAGPPIVIVGNGAPGCESPTPEPTPSPTPTPSPSPTPTEDPC